MLKVFSRQEVDKDVVINEVTVPDKDIIVDSESRGLENVGEFSWADDWQVARVTIMDIELVCSLPDVGLRENAFKLLRRDSQLKPVVQDCFVGQKVRNACRKGEETINFPKVRELSINDPDVRFRLCLRGAVCRCISAR